MLQNKERDIILFLYVNNIFIVAKIKTNTIIQERVLKNI